MDRQDPPTDPAVNLLGVFIMFRQRKRCYDVTLSRQEGSTTRHLASAQSKDRLAGGDTGRLFLTFGGPVSPTGVSNCPLDRVLTYKNLIYLLNLQFRRSLCIFKRPVRDACLCMGELQAPPAPHFVFLITL